MQYVSTRGSTPVSLDAALLKGIADDSGLFMPIELPSFAVDDFAGAGSLPKVASILLQPFFSGSSLETALMPILEQTFSFRIPVTPLQVPTGSAALLELYHGPTAAFKDVGAGFLAACLTRLVGAELRSGRPYVAEHRDVRERPCRESASAPLTILVATSGDTGGAVAAAFDDKPGMRVVVLFPDGRVSDRQARQLTCWGDNVLSLAVQGAFDDCQALVKSAMADQSLRRRYRFSSANSINIGRLLPQSTYYADASLRHFRDCGRKPGFVIPTGNLGNALACIMAREMGLPIGPIVLATNANKTISDYFDTLKWLPRASVQTLATAMDVGDPSNMERLRGLLGEADVLRGRLAVVSVDDEQIKTALQTDYAEFGFATCPHTATATHTWRHFDNELRQAHDWILVATAHPAKFETVVEPLIGAEVAMPAALEEIMSRPSRAVVIDSELAALATALEQRFGETTLDVPGVSRH